jgi:hypothetical protein
MKQRGAKKICWKVVGEKKKSEIKFKFVKYSRSKFYCLQNVRKHPVLNSKTNTDTLSADKWSNNICSNTLEQPRKESVLEATVYQSLRIHACLFGCLSFYLCVWMLICLYVCSSFWLKNKHWHVAHWKTIKWHSPNTLEHPRNESVLEANCLSISLFECMPVCLAVCLFTCEYACSYVCMYLPVFDSKTLTLLLTVTQSNDFCPNTLE